MSSEWLEYFLDKIPYLLLHIERGSPARLDLLEKMVSIYEANWGHKMLDIPSIFYLLSTSTTQPK
jgi:hypothetical protein